MTQLVKASLRHAHNAGRLHLSEHNKKVHDKAHDKAHDTSERCKQGRAAHREADDSAQAVLSPDRHSLRQIPVEGCKEHVSNLAEIVGVSISPSAMPMPLHMR